MHRLAAALTCAALITLGIAWPGQPAGATTRRIVHPAVYAPDPTYALTTASPATPLQAARWQDTTTATWTVTKLTFSTQAVMTQGVTSGSLRAVTTLPAGVASVISGGLQYTLNTPAVVAAGTRIWMTIQGITTPGPGSFYSNITMWDGATIVQEDRGYLTQNSATACPTGAWPASYIQAENALPGTAGWQIDPANSAQVSNKIATYADNPSLACGDTLRLRVNDLDLATLQITAYRLGYYNGAGARAVWATTPGPWLLGAAQPSARFVATGTAGDTENMVTADNWAQSVDIAIDGAWTPGAYLLAVRTSAGQGRYVPVVVRDTVGVHAQKVILNSAEWQAYNLYGDYDAYNKATPNYSQRISMDRPYLQDAGSGDLLTYEYGYIYWAEKQGLDVGYVLDTDVFADTSQLDGQHMITLIGHPEYWTQAAYDKLAAVRAAGANLLSLTANAMYWRIKMAASAVTGPNREYVITKLPGTDTDTFRMGGTPEQSQLGAMYGCANASGDGTSDTSWLWNGVTPGTAIPGLIKYEADGIMPGYPAAPGAAVVTTIPLNPTTTCTWDDKLYTGITTDAPGCPSACAWNPAMTHADVMAISGVPGGRVFHASDLYWCQTLMTSPALGQATANAVSFLTNGLAPAAPSRMASRLVAAPLPTRKLAKPRAQQPGPVAPPLPYYPPTADQDE